jgi:molybdopterin/thiamine biosynthesis adenylyltransferase
MHVSKLDQTSYQNNRVASFTVALVGLGTLGSELARLLGMLGLGTMILIDSDRVESGNMLQNLFFREAESLGQPKAQVIAEKGYIYFPQTRWLSHIREIADVGLGSLQNCSLIFSATDSTLARVETAYAARRLDIPMVDAGLMGPAYWRGRTSWFAAGREAACYFCQLQESRRAEILAFSQSPVLGCRWNDENIDMPSTPMTASIMAGMAIDLAFRHGLFPGENRSFAWELDLDNPPDLQAHQLRASATCPFHDFPATDALIELPYDMPFCKSLPDLGIPAIELDWPIVTTAVCQKCDSIWHPMRRLARMRRQGYCPCCGATNSLRFEAISEISANDTLARYSPRDLSYSREHLYTPLYRNDRDQR